MQDINTDYFATLFIKSTKEPYNRALFFPNYFESYNFSPGATFSFTNSETGKLLVVCGFDVVGYGFAVVVGFDIVGCGFEVVVGYGFGFEVVGCGFGVFCSVYGGDV